MPVPASLFTTSLSLPAIEAATPIPAQLQSDLCPSDRPLALLPVRLETRFFLLPDRAYELRIRVYPDKIHIDSHETGLTSNEQQWGQHFWEQYWRAGNDIDGQANAWRQLAERFDAARAGWLARVLRPTNAQDRPTAVVPPDQPLPKQPMFPALDGTVEGDADFSWRHAPVARLLPDRWIAVAYSAGKVAATATGKDIKHTLAVGPDPKAAPQPIGDDELAIDKGMKWMVDFDAAEEEGMGLRLEKDITRRVDLALYARRFRSLSSGEITIDVPDQGPVTAVRDDKVREAGADLGYRFRPNFRFAIVALYSDRQSSFSYFGVEGLLFGFNAQFNP